MAGRVAMTSETCGERKPIPIAGIGTAVASCARAIMDRPSAGEDYAFGDVLPPTILLQVPVGT
jgi:hypothetical protein